MTRPTTEYESGLLGQEHQYSSQPRADTGVRWQEIHFVEAINANDSMTNCH